MEGIENVQAVRRDTSVDRWLDEQEQPKDAKKTPVHPMDVRGKKRLHRKLLEWYHLEREKQSVNRYQMAIDQDFYDNLQYSDEDIQELNDRGQAALVFNEVASTIDWLIGTEKRTRVDFKVLPRTDDDVKPARAKTDTLKYLSDVNKTGFARSLAFADSIKVGVGWLEDGVRTDPTEELIFSRREDWRNMLWDSCGKERDLSDGRYIFRIRWADLDVAIAMFPSRRRQLEAAAVAAVTIGSEEDEDFWYLGQHFQERDARGEVIHRRTFVSDAAIVHNRRARVKLIECWYRVPERCFMCRGDVFDGETYDPRNPKMKQAVEQGATSLYDHLMMRVRCAMFTEGDMLQDMPSPYRHNRFPFTPIWCYIRGRDGMPYGAIRRLRDPQEDLNKRASKSLFMLSTNRVVADADAVEDHDEAREEASRPDAYIIKKRGAEFRIENNTELGQAHMNLMDRDALMIQKAGGVTDENLGRQTNAVSGEAIKARQLQGSVVTAEPFDNLRFAVQLQGEITLSLAEQFMSEPKVIRLVGAKDKIDWLRINQPEVAEDGTVRWTNDITASKADFIVDEQDFNQSVRQAMFQSMSDLVAKIATISPVAALKILKMALEFSDLPNKEDMAKEIAAIVGISDKDVEDMSPEERQAYEQQQGLEREQQAMQLEAQRKDLAQKAADVDKTLAEARKNQAQAAEAAASATQLMQQIRQGMVDGQVAVAEGKAQNAEALTNQVMQGIASVGDQTGMALREVAKLIAAQGEQTNKAIAMLAQVVAQQQGGEAKPAEPQT